MIGGMQLGKDSVILVTLAFFERTPLVYNIMLSVLTFVRHYLPGYKHGGPLRTIANMVEALGDEFSFRIVTLDRDATDTEPYPDLPSDGGWVNVGKAAVLYLPPDKKSFRHFARIIRETPHDSVYLNSFFDPVFTLKPLLARRLGLVPDARWIIAPRGEFSPGALDLKAWKKRPFIAGVRAAGVYRGLTWQASSEHEEADIRRALGSDAERIHIAPDLPGGAAPANAAVAGPRKDGEPLRICFLSRVSPMKNLAYALDVLARVRVPVRFDIYGPLDDRRYWDECRSRISRLPANVVADYRGAVGHAEVLSVLARYDLFFLPTLGENYGHVICEALAAGTPVLIADTTPWRDLAESGVGWALPLSAPGAFAEKIEWLARAVCVERTRMRICALSYVKKMRDQGSAIESNRRMLLVSARN